MGEISKDSVRRNTPEDRLGSVVYSSKDNESMHKSLNGEFTLYRLLIDQILDGKYSLNLKNSHSLSKYFHPDDEKDKKLLKEYDKKYQSNQAIYWYTRESPVYKNLNKALRTQNTNDIVPFATFIKDLNRQLDDEHQLFLKQLQTNQFQVYRGQFISKDEIIRLKSSIGDLISMNSFLSTSTNRKKAFEFATSRAPPTDDLCSVLLQMNIDINIQSKPYADIKRLSAFPDEEEILFVVGCVFKIEKISFNEKDNLWMAELSLCSEKNSDMEKFSKDLNKDLNEQNNLISLANYLIDMNKYDQAQIFLESILNNNVLKNSIDFAYCYFIFGKVHEKKGNYMNSIENLNKSLDYLLNDEKLNEHSLVSECYNQLGLVYCSQEDYQKSFEFYDTALDTKNNISSITYFGLAKIHYKEKNHHLALDYLNKILKNQQELKSSFIANVYIHIAMNLTALGKTEEAGKILNNIIQLQTKELHDKHPDLSYTYHQIGLMYLEQNDFEKSLEFINKAYQLQLDSLPNNHPDFAETFQNYAEYYLKKKNLDKSLFYFEKRLENQLKTLSWDHPNVMKTYYDLGNIHWKKRNYNQASDYFQKILQAELERKKIGESALSTSYKTLADLYFDQYKTSLDKNVLDQAIPFYLNYLKNELETKLVEDESLIDVYKILAEISYKKHQLNHSLLYYNRLLNCYFQKESLHKKEIHETYELIQKIYLKRKNLNQSLLYYSNLHSNEIENKSRHIKNVHFENCYLDQTLNYFSNLLKKQMKKKSQNLPRINELNFILGNICYDKKDYDKSYEYFSLLLINELDKKPYNDISLKTLYETIGNIYLKKKDYNRSLIYYFHSLNCQLNEKSFSQIGKIFLIKDYFIHSRNDKLMTKLDNYLKDFHLENSLIHHVDFYFTNLLHNPLKQFSTNEIYEILGNIYLKQQNYYQALNYFQSLLNQQMKDNSSLVWIYLVIADIYLKQGHSNQAQQFYQYSLNLARQFHSSNQSLIELIQNRIQTGIIPIL